MKRRVRTGAAGLALLVAAVVAAPLPAAICQVASKGCCPLMRGAENAYCHRDGAMVAPMDCCKPKAAPAPKSVDENAGARLLQPSISVDLPALDAEARVAGSPLRGVRMPVRVAESLHALGLFTLLEVFRV